MFFKIKKMTVASLAVIFFVVLDRLLKAWAVSSVGREASLIDDIFKFKFQANYFLAFSLPLGGRWLNLAIGLIILFLIYLLVKYRADEVGLKTLSLLGVILGAASNLYDRLAYGFVIDYLDLKYFTVFNLADALIVAGISILLMVNIKRAEERPF